MPLGRLFAPDFDWREWPDEPGDWTTWLLRGGFLPALCFLQYWQLKQQLYHAEVQDMEAVQGLLYFTADGQLSLHEKYFNRPESRR
jgi:hypothetical protein